jgi:putative PIN family toxin of toxin-antitoxin system
MVVVFDTDVLIPLILPASRSTRLFSRLTAAGHQLGISPQILEEVQEKMRTSAKLRKWLALPDNDIEKFLKNLPTICVLTPGVLTVHGAVIADPKDDKIIAAAAECGASHIISEDWHLRKVGQWHGILIMNRDEFAAELDRLEAPSG